MNVPEDGNRDTRAAVCVVAPGVLGHLSAEPRPLLLGPWCVSEETMAAGGWEVVPGYGGRDLPDQALLDTVYDEVARLASSALDRFHGSAIGATYWSTFTGQFLAALIPVVADLQGRLEAVATGGAPPTIHGTAPALVPTSNRHALSDVYFDADTIGQLATGLAHVRSLDVRWHERVVTTPSTWGKPSSGRKRPARALGVWTNRVAGWLHGDKRFGAWVLGVSEVDRRRSGRRLRESILPMPKVPPDRLDSARTPWDPESRARLATAFGKAAEAAESDLARATLEVAHVVLPWQFVEGWDASKDFESLKGIARRRLIVAMFPSERSLSLLATAKALGAKLAFYQHGGVYGEGPLGWPERYERRASDGFLSWGWRDGDDVVPAPSLRLESFAERYRQAAARQAETGGAAPVKYYTNHTSDEPHGYGLGSTKRVEQFAYVDDVLEPTVRTCGHVIVRKHPKASRLGTQGGDTPESVSFEDLKVSSAESVATSSLIVLDLFRSTTFLECITVGHPVVVFLAREPAPRDERQAELIGALRRAKVLNVGRDEMETFWRDRYPDLHGWWSNDGVQAAIAAYRERYAWVSAPWVEAFTTVVQEWFDRTNAEDRIR